MILQNQVELRTGQQSLRTGQELIMDNQAILAKQMDSNLQMLLSRTENKHLNQHLIQAIENLNNQQTVNIQQAIEQEVQLKAYG